MSASNTQVGGDHYAKLAIQPMKFAMANNWDACAYGILKYVTRHQDKNGQTDIGKALHLVALRQELLAGVHWRPEQVMPVITMGEYLSQNRIAVHEAAALNALQYWVYSGSQRKRHELLIALGILHNRYNQGGYDLQKQASTQKPAGWCADCFKDAQYPAAKL